jgi:hypothetical protein
MPPAAASKPDGTKIPFLAGATCVTQRARGDLVAHPAELFDRAVFGFVGVESGAEVSKPFCHNRIGIVGQQGLEPWTDGL